MNRLASNMCLDFHYVGQQIDWSQKYSRSDLLNVAVIERTRTKPYQKVAFAGFSEYAHLNARQIAIAKHCLWRIENALAVHFILSTVGQLASLINDGTRYPPFVGTVYLHFLADQQEEPIDGNDLAGALMVLPSSVCKDFVVCGLGNSDLQSMTEVAKLAIKVRLVRNISRVLRPLFEVRTETQARAVRDRLRRGGGTLPFFFGAGLWPAPRKCLGPPLVLVGSVGF